MKAYDIGAQLCCGACGRILLALGWFDVEQRRVRMGCVALGCPENGKEYWYEPPTVELKPVDENQAT